MYGIKCWDLPIPRGPDLRKFQIWSDWIGEITCEAAGKTLDSNPCTGTGRLR